MGKLEVFEISFTDNKLVYSPGDAITGTVNITNVESIQCKGRRNIVLFTFVYLYSSYLPVTLRGGLEKLARSLTKNPSLSVVAVAKIGQMLR